MSAGKVRKSVPISETVVVNAREVNVAIEGLDSTGIAGSFKVNLIKDGEVIASRFFFQTSGGSEAAGTAGASRSAHFDFFLPIDVVAEGRLRVEIEPVAPLGPGEPPLSERIGQPTLSIYLMLESV
jgi:hypothetical protein